jgi:hypothetical protein
MKEFIFTSKLFEGSLRFRYNVDGTLEQFECKAELTPQQVNFFTNNFPFRLEFLKLIEEKAQGKMVEITYLSFENFWEAYDYKVDKIKAQKYWEKMSKVDKALALTGIYKYRNRSIIKGISLVYPERYLKYKRWEDE